MTDLQFLIRHSVLKQYILRFSVVFYDNVSVIFLKCNVSVFEIIEGVSFALTSLSFFCWGWGGFRNNTHFISRNLVENLFGTLSSHVLKVYIA